MFPNHVSHENQRAFQIEQLRTAIEHQTQVRLLNERRIAAMRALRDARVNHVDKLQDTIVDCAELRAQCDIDTADIAIAEFNNDFAVKGLEMMKAQLAQLEDPSPLLLARLTQRPA